MKKLPLAVASICLIWLAGCQTVPSGSGGNAQLTARYLHHKKNYNPVPNTQTFILGVNKEHSWKRIADTTGIASSPTVEKVELRDGDCAYKDCSGDLNANRGVGGRGKTYRERTETYIAPNGSDWGLGSHVWYGLDVYVDSETLARINKHPSPTIAVVDMKLGVRRPSQYEKFGDGGVGAPVFGILYGGRGRDIRAVLSIDELGGKSSKLGYIREIKDRWVRYEIEALWSREEDGFLRVYMDGKLAAVFKGPTVLQEGRADFVSFKYGVYSVYHDSPPTDEFDLEKDGAGDRIFLFDNVSVAKKREDLFQNID